VQDFGFPVSQLKKISGIVVDRISVTWADVV